MSFPKKPGSALLSVPPIYDYPTARGYKTEKKYVIIEGWPVQFLPPGDAVGEEALAQAVETTLGATPPFTRLDQPGCGEAHTAMLREAGPLL